jgi:hypothetical protein
MYKIAHLPTNATARNPAMGIAGQSFATDASEIGSLGNKHSLARAFI